MLEPTKRFSSRAFYYVRGRPGYPSDLVEFFRSTLGVRANSPIADVGSGTGLLTELLLDLGGPVYAIEPNLEMRRAAEERLVHHPNFQTVDAAAEATGLGDKSIYLITAGQAAHWFDRPEAHREFGRILMPHGWLALVWNQRRSHPGSFGAAYAGLMDEFRDEQIVETRQKLTSGDRRATAELFGHDQIKEARFDNHQTLDLQGLEWRVLSMSSMPLPGHDRYDELLAGTRGIFDKFQVGGTVQIEYDTRVYYGHVAVPLDPCSSRSPNAAI
jgi:SAM-dependent methyltransferase